MDAPADRRNARGCRGVLGHTGPGSRGSSAIAADRTGPSPNHPQIPIICQTSGWSIWSSRDRRYGRLGFTVTGRCLSLAELGAGPGRLVVPVGVDNPLHEAVADHVSPVKG